MGRRDTPNEYRSQGQGKSRHVHQGGAARLAPPLASDPAPPDRAVTIPRTSAAARSRRFPRPPSVFRGGPRRSSRRGQLARPRAAFPVAGARRTSGRPAGAGRVVDSIGLRT